MHLCDRGNNGGCDDVCNKNGEGVTCSCKLYYKLADDGVTCEIGLYILII